MSEQLEQRVAEIAGHIRHRLGNYGFLKGGTAPGPIDREIMVVIRPFVRSLYLQDDRLKLAREIIEKLQNVPVEQPDVSDLLVRLDARRSEQGGDDS